MTKTTAGIYTGADHVAFHYCEGMLLSLRRANDMGLPVDVSAALVTDPTLMALVLVAGLATAAALAVFVVDTVSQIKRSE
jgi:hypothetical protein